MEKTTSATSDLITTAQIMTATILLGEVPTLTSRFAKQVLTRLEGDGILKENDPQSQVTRKHILDGFADLKRAMLEALRDIPLE